MAEDNQNIDLRTMLDYSNAQQGFERIVKMLKKHNPGELDQDHPVAQFETRIKAALQGVGDLIEECSSAQNARPLQLVEKMKRLSDEISPPISAVCDITMYQGLSTQREVEQASERLRAFIPDEYDRIDLRRSFMALQALHHRLRNFEVMSSPAFDALVQNRREPEYRWSPELSIDLDEKVEPAYNTIRGFTDYTEAAQIFHDTGNDLGALQHTIASYRDGSCELAELLAGVASCVGRFDEELPKVEQALREEAPTAVSENAIRDSVACIRDFQAKLRDTAQQLMAIGEASAQNPVRRASAGTRSGGV